MLASVVGIIQADRDNLGRINRRQRPQALQRYRFLIEGGRAENVSVRTVNLALDNFGVEDLVAFLESSNGRHKPDEVKTAVPSPQD